MKTHAVIEEAPPGNFTTLAECDGQEAAEAFVKGQPGRALIIQDKDGASAVISHDGLSVVAVK